MADPGAEGRIRDLKRRLELEPASRLFVALAEEYRKTGQLAEALSTLQRGLLAHPGYLSAHVALGRAYLESGQITEAIATFSKVLANDPGNLVSAKSLADIYLSRGESVEAIKKYKLYRALSGDRTVDEIVERLEIELAPPPPGSDAQAAAPPPPPPTFFEGKTGPIRSSREIKFEPSALSSSTADLDLTSVKFEPDDSTASRRSVTEPMPMSRDIPLMISPKIPTPPPLPPPEEEVTTRAFRIGDVLESTGGTPAAPETPPEGRAEGEPQGRVLADLYFAQGHYTEALRIYDDLVAATPFDPELKRMRREAEARLLPAANTPGAATSDKGLERRLAKVRALKRWLSVVQTG
ncbi:MAG TPA: tetratricopeptide repeat protein [Thermoanaerobaculia bacterium]